MLGLFRFNLGLILIILLSLLYDIDDFSGKQAKNTTSRVTTELLEETDLLLFMAKTLLPSGPSTNFEEKKLHDFFGKQT